MRQPYRHSINSHDLNNQSISQFNHTPVACVVEQLSTTSQVLSLSRATAPQAPSHSPCHCTSGSALRSSRAQFPMTDVNTYWSNTPLVGHRQHVSSPYPFGTPASQAFTRTAVNTSQVRSPPIDPGLISTGKHTPFNSIDFTAISPNNSYSQLSSSVHYSLIK